MHATLTKASLPHTQPRGIQLCFAFKSVGRSFFSVSINFNKRNRQIYVPLGQNGEGIMFAPCRAIKSVTRSVTTRFQQGM